MLESPHYPVGIKRIVTPLSQTRKKAILEEVQKARRRRTVVAAIIAVILIAIIVVGVYSLTRPKDIYIQTVPAGIGTAGNCNRPLHTHDASGTIHVETDENRDYVLGDFFLIWGKIFNSSGVFPSNQPLPSYLDRCVSGTLLYHSHPVLMINYSTKGNSRISMTVNGTPQPLMQNFTIPRDTATNPTNILITYGPGIPASF